MVLDYEDSLDPQNEQDYILDFNLKVSAETIDIGKLMVKPMNGNGPEKVGRGKDIKDFPPGKSDKEDTADTTNKETNPGKKEDDNKEKPGSNKPSENQSDDKNQPNKRK